MGKTKRRLPHGLRRRIFLFGLVIVLTITTTGILLGTVSMLSGKRYQQVLQQVTEIRQLRADVGKTSELLQNYIITEENLSAECFATWQGLSQQIEALKPGNTEMSALMVKNLQNYQRATNAGFYALMQQVGGDDVSRLYQEFLKQQEDRMFLCDLLMDHLMEQMTIQYATITSENTSYLTLFGITLICLLVLTVLFSLSFSSDVYQPIQKLVDQSREIMEGHYEVDDLPVAQQDEIGYLTGVFNEMKHRIGENFQNKEKLWKMESLLRDAEYRALQSQVNPHFLFNVLGVATAAALTENADQTVDVIENISYMLHYSLTSVRENSLLEEELKMVRSYLFLQQRRFGDRITFTFTLVEEDALLECRIPGMTLQPLVENAVQHGVEHMTRGGRIDISVRRVDDSVHVVIRDNGCGMTAEQVDALLHGQLAYSGSGSTGLGFHNVRNRLEAFYQRTDLLCIESSVGQGTTISLRYPIKGGHEYVLGAHRG